MSFLAETVYAWFLPLLLIGGGALLFYKTGGGAFRHPARAAKLLMTPEPGSGTSPARALSVALAGTLGVGNIAGVGLAISAGGAGALLWMWIAGAFAVTVKYAEVTLALAYRPKETPGRGGAMYYVKAAFRGSPGRVAAAFFAVLCLAASLFIGTLTQANAIALSCEEAFRVPRTATGILLSVLAAVSFTGGTSKIGATAEKLVPFMTVCYCVLAAGGIVRHAPALGDAVRAIFRDAFSFRSVAGGGAGYLITRAVRCGVSRGLFSNEAGCGTSPLAHAASNTKIPAKQGLCGAVEVFVDTFLICTLTGFLILTAFPDGVPSGDGIYVVIAAFRATYGDAAPFLVAVTVFVFAFGTVLSWAYYGQTALSYFTDEHRYRDLFLAVYCLSLLPGAWLSSDFLYGVTDFLVAAMTTVNMTAVIALSGRVAEETRRLWELFPRERKKEKIGGRA